MSTLLGVAISHSSYTGITTNLQRGEKRHNGGSGSKYTRGRLRVPIMYVESYSTRAQAARREQQIKRWTKKRKENLIHYGHPHGIRLPT